MNYANYSIYSVYIPIFNRCEAQDPLSIPGSLSLVKIRFLFGCNGNWTDNSDKDKCISFHSLTINIDKPEPGPVQSPSPNSQKSNSNRESGICLWAIT